VLNDTKQERHARYKHSSLLQKSVSYGQKSFITLAPGRDRCPKWWKEKLKQKLWIFKKISGNPFSDEKVALRIWCFSRKKMYFGQKMCFQKTKLLVIWAYPDYTECILSYFYKKNKNVAKSDAKKILIKNEKMTTDFCIFTV